MSAMQRKPPPPPPRIQPLEAAIASRCLQELVCDGNSESVLRSMTSFQKAANCILPELLSVTLQTHFKMRRNSRPYRFLSVLWTEMYRSNAYFPRRPLPGGPRPRIRLIRFTSELCNMPYRTQPTDYVWAFASLTVFRSLTGYGLHPTRKRINPYIPT